MQNLILKSIILNVSALILATAFGLCYFEGVSMGAALLFTAIILWLCNEVWYWLISLPVLIAAIVGEIRRKPLSEKTGGKFIRLGSLSLLVTPHILFAILYGLNNITQGKLASEIGIPLEQSCFIIAFIAVALLWVFNMVTCMVPLSVGVLFSRIFEPELWTEDTTPAEVDPLRALEELPRGVLYHSQPVLSVTPAHVRGNFRTGLFLLPFVLLLLGMAVGFVGQSIYAAVFCGLPALLFGFVSIHFLRWPSLWRKRLEGVEYSFSRDTVYITDKGVKRSYALDEGLNLSHEVVEGKVGNIYISPTGKVGRAFKGILGKMKVDVVDTSMQSDLNAPLMGFFQIEDSMNIFKLLVSCRDNKEEN